MGSRAFQPLSKPANANPVQARRRLGDDVWNIARRALSSTSTAELYAHRSEYFLVQYALFNTSHGHLFLLVRSTTSCRTVDSGAVRSLATLLRSASRLLLFNTLRSVGCNLYASRAAPRAHAIMLYCHFGHCALSHMPSSLLSPRVWGVAVGALPRACGRLYFPLLEPIPHPQCTDVKGGSDSNRPSYPERPVLGVPVRLAPQWTNAAV